MYGTTTHRHDTPDTIDRLVQGFSLSEQHQIEGKGALPYPVSAIGWHGGDVSRPGTDVTEKSMQDMTQYDALSRLPDKPPSLTDSASPPQHQEALHNAEFPLQMLRHLGPDMACMLDGALERQRVVIDAAHHALDGLGEANRALIADLAESRANEANLAAALDSLRTSHRATEASQQKQLASLYAAQSVAQNELSTFHRLATADRGEIARLHDEIEAMDTEMSRLRADSVAIHTDNTSMQNTIAAQRRAEASLRDEIARLAAAKEKTNAELSLFQRQYLTLKASLDDKDALIDALRREVDSEKKVSLSVHSLLVAISGFPPQGQHWEDLSASLKLSRQSPCESVAGWQWLQAWDDGAEAPDTHRSTTAALCFACVCLHNWMDDHRKARDCLQSLVNSLEGAAELPVGLCHTVLFAVLDAANQRPLRFDVAFLLCQAAKLIAVKCPSSGRKEAAAKVRACVSRDCADKALLDALLGGWDGALVDRVPFCTPMLAQDGEMVYVQSIDSLLFVSQEKLRLRWISVRRIDWTKSSVDTVHLHSGDVSQKVKFGQMFRKKCRLLTGIPRGKEHPNFKSMRGHAQGSHRQWNTRCEDLATMED
ncbi:hypothetical protein ISF_09758 [Cordyceps fumosorosea ARSEF 2679]|uniref:Uncharacterized protein n=1 Tax=Cordyceps fumosorosea (strain ARSEF 2679) TaxID=1081104 RepID=A0A167D1A6_CORFA|nr:hypothetical protein ISF_09758 [Cordyceps fumosorosea ARSEF 2679]OAA41830.1 hypothetical protein ISF_09758 [Cordyceps fumosorosea ARSEF 2679]